MAPSWNELQIQLNLILQREIHLMREILANMHQEELTLLMNDKENWAKIMQERSDLTIQIRGIRLQREEETKKLRQLILNSKESSMHEVLQKEGEFLSLLDQIFALIERTNLQNCRNDFLFYQPKHQLPLECSYPPPFKTAPKKSSSRKATVATENRKKP